MASLMKGVTSSWGKGLKPKSKGMKGIILAGGSGTRLSPLTQVMSKQLLPIYDKPMIYYPLANLMQAGIREILLIATPTDLPRFQSLFGDGSKLGISISYVEQESPRGIAEAFILGKSFIGQDSVALILGDNLFYGDHLESILMQATNLKSGALVFGYHVKDPERYGVLAFDDHKQVKSIIEKPQMPPSSYAVTGLYFYDNDVISIAETLTPSERGELEITDVNQEYLNRGRLNVHLFDRGFAWLDTGTCDALQKAAHYVQTIQERQGIKIGCIEEIAYEKGWIAEEGLQALADCQSKSEYGQYLLRSAPLSASL